MFVLTENTPAFYVACALREMYEEQRESKETGGYCPEPTVGRLMDMYCLQFADDDPNGKLVSLETAEYDAVLAFMEGYSALAKEGIIRPDVSSDAEEGESFRDTRLLPLGMGRRGPVPLSDGLLKVFTSVPRFFESPSDKCGPDGKPLRITSTTPEEAVEKIRGLGINLSDRDVDKELKLLCAFGFLIEKRNEEGHRAYARSKWYS